MDHLPAAAQTKLRGYLPLDFDDKDMTYINCSLRENLDEKRYGQVMVSGVYAFVGKTPSIIVGKECYFKSIITTLDGPGSKYCFNKGGEHKEGSVYFEIDLSSFTDSPVFKQKCWSNNGYRLRLCSGFSSGVLNKLGRMTQRLTRLLCHHHIGGYPPEYRDDDFEIRQDGSRWRNGKRLCIGDSDKCPKRQRARSSYCFSHAAEHGEHSSEHCNFFNCTGGAQYKCQGLCLKHFKEVHGQSY